MGEGCSQEKSSIQETIAYCQEIKSHLPGHMQQEVGLGSELRFSSCQ